MSTDMHTHPDPEPVTELTIEEYLDTLNGFDEIAIGRHFNGLDVYQPVNTGQQARALIFVDQRRRGLKDAAALEHAQQLTLRVVRTYFTDPEVAKRGDVVETADGFQTRSPLGEGEPAAGGTHAAEPSGASRPGSPGASGTS